MKTTFSMAVDATKAISGRWAFIASREWAPRYMLYILFFFASLSAFVYIRFPSERLVPLVNSALDKAPLAVETRGVLLTIPPGLKLTGVTVSENRRPGALIVTIPELRIRPSFSALLMGRKKADIHAEAAGGSIDGVFSAVGEKEPDIEMSLNFSGIDPGKAEWWDKFTWFKLEGIIEGRGKLDVRKSDVMSGEGSIQADLADGKISLSKSLSPSGESFTLTKGELELKIAKGMITVVKGSFFGPDINLQISGGASLSQDLLDSRLNITATIIMSPPLKNRLGLLASFLPPANQEGKHMLRLGGTLAQPVMR